MLSRRSLRSWEMTRVASSRSRLDRNGYAPSILQQDECCFLCGRRDRKLDRHEPFGGPYRAKSKADGLWLLLCHYPCHEGPTGAHGSARVNNYLRAYTQGKAMEVFGWSVEEWREHYGKNYL